MFKYLIRLFTVFSLLFPVVTHAAISITTQLCLDATVRVPAGCASSAVYDDSCYRPLGCDTSVGCEVTTNGCNVTCTWPGCDLVVPDICEKGYWLNGECVACPDYANCSKGQITLCYQGYSLVTVDKVKRCYCPSSKYENLAEGKCEPCPALLTNGVCIPCPDGMVVNGACVSCPKGLVVNGACVDCPKNGTCKNGTFTGCNDSYIKYYETDRFSCVACGDRCMDNSTCPLYGECFTDTSNTGPEFEQCVEGFTMVLDLDAGSVKCLCADNAYINSSGQCVACLDNAVCRDEKLTECKQGFQQLTDESGNIIGCASCTPNGTCLNGEFQYCNDNYYGNENGCYKCPGFSGLEGKSTPGSNADISKCRVEGPGEDERGYFSFESGTCNATNVTIE